MNTVNLAPALLCGASALAIVSAAYAQTTPPPPAASEIVVTGSRVIANGNNSPTPLTVVSADQLNQLEPTTINDALNDLPQFQGSRGQFSVPNTTGNFGGGNPATDELNLRNLQAQRTLILFDGQRVAPTNSLGIVDVDMVPQELIQRVDIVTGGVSAVYGSDAIAGVVNYITDKNFNGFKAEANYGESTYGDDQSWKAGFAAGTKLFDGKGHIEISFDHYDDAGVPHRDDRGYYSCSLLGATPGAAASTLGTAANPYQDFCNVHSTQNTYGGLITNGALKNQTFDSNGVLSPFNAGTPTGTANSNIGGDGSQASAYESLEAAVKFDQLFGRFDYDLTDQIHFHTEAAANWKADTTYSSSTSVNNETYANNNAFLTPAQQAALAGASTFTMSKNYSEMPLLTQVSNVENFFLNVGFDGKVLNKFDWGLDVNYGNNTIHDAFNNNINQQKLAAALDAVVNPATGQVVCNASLTNSAYANCVPFNAFGPTAASQAAINYVTQTTHYVPVFTQIEIGGHIAGDIFDLPAGPVTAALSGEYRKQSFFDDSDATPTQFENCTSLRYNCSTGTAVFNTSFSPSPTVSQSVKEGAVEFDAPLLKDVPFVQSFNLNGALRYTSYDFGGNNWTWKIGLDWHVNDEVTLRATQSQDIEAPTLGMLFQPALVVVGTNDLDYLTGQTNTVPQVGIGNPNLVSEVGHTTTAGFVWKPTFAPGFSMSVDAYHIIVDNALTQIQGQAASTQDECIATQGASPVCATIVRPLGNQTNTTAANSATTYYDIFLNLSSIETYGADFEVDYAHRVLDRPFSARVLMNWQPHYIVKEPGVPTYDYGGVTFPNLVPLQDVPAVQLTAMFNLGVTDNFFVGVVEKWRSAMQLEPSGTGIYLTPGAGAYATTNLDFTYRLRPGDEFYLNIRNLFNNLAQQVVGLSNSNGYPQTDDPIGRYITVGVRFKY